MAARRGKLGAFRAPLWAQRGVVAIVLVILVYVPIRLFPLVVGAAIDTIRAQSWQSVEATVLNVQLESRRHGKRVVCDYLFTLDGRDHTGNRFEILDYRRGWAAVPEGMVPGATITVFVNPADSSESVYDRSWSSWLLPGMFMLIAGLGCLVAIIIVTRRLIAEVMPSQRKVGVRTPGGAGG